MKTATVLAVILCSGIGTFLIRWLPMRWQERGTGGAMKAGWLRRALDAIGPAAIVALLTVSLVGLLEPQEPVASALPLLAGLLGVVAGRRYLHTIAWSTLTGVLAYGAAVWLVQAAG